jgi:hypothetical protein
VPFCTSALSTDTVHINQNAKAALTTYNLRRCLLCSPAMSRYGSYTVETELPVAPEQWYRGGLSSRGTAGNSQPSVGSVSTLEPPRVSHSVYSTPGYTDDPSQCVVQQRGSANPQSSDFPRPCSNKFFGFSIDRSPFIYIPSSRQTSRTIPSSRPEGRFVG